jgi:hypothetical protein
MQRNFRAFLQESLSELERTEPDVDRALREALGSLRARLTTEGASLVISSDVTGWRISEDMPATDVDVAFDDQIIIDLIEGELTLNDAISRERLRISGSVDKVANFHDALLVYLEGLIRARGTPEILRRYRAS